MELWQEWRQNTLEFFNGDPVPACDTKKGYYDIMPEKEKTKVDDKKGNKVALIGCVIGCMALALIVVCCVVFVPQMLHTILR